MMEIQESVIRRMTRLAIEHRAVNLSQGFTDEAPAYEMVWGGISALLGGTDEYIDHLERLTLKQILEEEGGKEDLLALGLKDLLAQFQNPQDLFNQYSFPFGLPELRKAIAEYTRRFRDFHPDPDTEITVVLGATEGLACSLRAACRPGDGVIVIQPFHEMYPSQARVFGLRPEYVSLRENPALGKWELDREEFETAINKDARVLVLNTPHNPTGKVFTKEELLFIAECCRRKDLLVITDEIYEHILYGSSEHHCLATFEDMREHTIVLNSISKTGNATGWRIGWVLSPRTYTASIRAIHDSLVIQAPTPLQKGAVHLLGLGNDFYDQIRRTYRKKLGILMTALQQVGFQITPPEGSYYLFANYRQIPVLRELSPTDAAMFLIKKIGVASVPGDNFYQVGNSGDQYLRFAFCRGMDTLGEAARRLQALEN